MTGINKATDKDTYGGLSTEEIETYKNEAKERWGETDAYKQSQQRVKNFSKEDWSKMSAETDDNLRGLVELMLAGKKPDSPEVQVHISRHHAGIERFYDCSSQIYRGLADGYLADQRFADFYRKYHADLPEFLVAGMHAWCDRREN